MSCSKISRCLTSLSTILCRSKHHLKLLPEIPLSGYYLSHSHTDLFEIILSISETKITRYLKQGLIAYHWEKYDLFLSFLEDLDIPRHFLEEKSIALMPYTLANDYPQFCYFDLHFSYLQTSGMCKFRLYLLPSTLKFYDSYFFPLKNDFSIFLII